MKRDSEYLRRWKETQKYIAQGIPVFPVQGKVPYKGTRGFYDATTDPHQIQWWWRRWPDANIAVPTGYPSGWIVLDIDGPNGFRSLKHLHVLLQDRAEGQLPRTLSSRTGTGYHLIYALPTDEKELLRSRVHIIGLPGLDIRGYNGYIVVPHSLHASGRRYQWVQVMKPVPFPVPLMEILGEKERVSFSKVSSPSLFLGTRNDPEHWLQSAVSRAQVGTRHHCALWLACHLIEQEHLSYEEAVPYMHRYVNHIPGGGEDYSYGDALGCLEWAAKTVGRKGR